MTFDHDKFLPPFVKLSTSPCCTYFSSQYNGTHYNDNAQHSARYNSTERTPLPLPGKSQRTHLSTVNVINDRPIDSAHFAQPMSHDSTYTSLSLAHVCSDRPADSTGIVSYIRRQYVRTVPNVDIVGSSKWHTRHLEHAHRRSYVSNSTSSSSIFRNLFWTFRICQFATGRAIIWMKNGRGSARHKSTRTLCTIVSCVELLLFFLVLLHHVKHIVFEGKITFLEEKDHRYVDDIKIVFQCELDVGCCFAIVEWCAECKVWRTRCQSHYNFIEPVSKDFNPTDQIGQIDQSYFLASKLKSLISDQL